MIQDVRLIPAKQCAFVSFVDRKQAETAFETLYERLFINHKKIKLLWAKT